MTTFRARTPCTIRRSQRAYDRNGKETVSEIRIKTRCGVIWVRDESQPTSVRVDSSASRGRADENINDARLLFEPAADLKLGDLVEVDGVVIEIVSVWRRPDVAGRIHHIQVEGQRWG